MFGLLRYILASLVIVTHLGPVEWKYTGYYAVLCFFTLSGYILSAAYERYQSISPNLVYIRFYANRLTRVFPAYFACLAITIGLVSITPELSKLAHPLTYMPESIAQWANNIFIINSGTLIGNIPEPLLIPQIWSLGVELLYWLILPFTLGRPKVLLLWLALGFSYATIAALYPFGFNARYFALCAGGLSFALGAWLYHCKWHALLTSHALRLCLIALCFGYYLAAYPVLAKPNLFGPSFPLHWGIYLAPFFNVVLIACFASLSKERFSPILQKWDNRLGDISYPLFLNHITAGIILMAAFNLEAHFRHWPFTLIALVASSFAAYLIWFFVERPFEGLRSRLRSLDVSGKD